MEDLLASKKTFLKTYKRGDKIKAKIIEITSKSVRLDIGGKSYGLVAEKAFHEARDFIRKLKVGDELTTEVIVGETPDGFTICSFRHAASDYVWDELTLAKKENRAVEAVVRGINPAGLSVEVMGVGGFVPQSHIGTKLLKDLESVQGKGIKVKIIELNKTGNRVVLSERAVSEKEKIAKTQTFLDKVKINEIYQGEVVKVTDFGIFVKFLVNEAEKIYLEGLVHVSELSWEKVERPSDVIKVGDKIKVKIIEKTNDRLSLSAKQVNDDPWIKVAQKYSPEQKVKGKVSKVSDFGVFVQLEPGIEGLVHMTKIPPNKKISEGDAINVYIEEIDAAKKKLSLGLVLTEKPVGYK